MARASSVGPGGEGDKVAMGGTAHPRLLGGGACVWPGSPAVSLWGVGRAPAWVVFSVF